MSQNLFTIKEVELKNQNQTTGSPLLYAANMDNSFEWGALCSNTNTPVANFPILYYPNPIPQITFLQLATLKGQYQLYWNDSGAAGQGVIMAQCLTTEINYPKNQIALWSGSTAAAKSFKLIIDLSATSNMEGISLQPL